MSSELHAAAQHCSACLPHPLPPLSLRGEQHDLQLPCESSNSHCLRINSHTVREEVRRPHLIAVDDVRLIPHGQLAAGFLKLMISKKCMVSAFG